MKNGSKQRSARRQARYGGYWEWHSKDKFIDYRLIFSEPEKFRKESGVPIHPRCARAVVPVENDR